VTTHPIVAGGLAVGILDILAAFAVRYAFTRGAPTRVLQGIASGLLGPAAFSGGAATALLGLALHFVIAFGAAAVYFAVSRRWRFLVRHPIISGLAYGVIVHWVMNTVVLPLSRLPMGPRTPPVSFTLTMIVVHMLFVGLPIALAVKWGERAPAHYVPQNVR
jgi:hypothetical protein